MDDFKEDDNEAKDETEVKQDKAKAMGPEGKMGSPFGIEAGKGCCVCLSVEDDDDEGGVEYGFWTALGWLFVRAVGFGQPPLLPRLTTD